MIWLGDKFGYLSDWVTQLWVKVTGRKVRIANYPWLKGPSGEMRIIGSDFFSEYALKNDLEIDETGSRGLLREFRELAGAENDPESVSPAVRDFYERTSDYELDAWSEWGGLFRPLGDALALIFSRRLQQLNIPLSSLDTSRGMSSRVLTLRDTKLGEVQTAWIRDLHATGHTLYAGSYSVCVVPGYRDPCVKVVFPLPNGAAMVIMKPTSHVDGSFSLTSTGNSFGDPGFYFVVREEGEMVFARYVRSLQERITVYAAEQNTVRADHVLWIWGKQFLKLHYRMRESVLD